MRKHGCGVHRHALICDRDRGFTLIELLVVVIVVGVLASIAIPAYLNQRDKASKGASKANMRSVIPVVMTARENTRKTLTQITGSTCTACQCTGVSPAPVTSTAFTGTCANAWNQQTGTIATAAGEPLASMQRLLTDGWGYPILLDENENDASWGGQCGLTTNPSGGDLFISAGRDHVFGTSDDFSTVIPLGGCL